MSNDMLESDRIQELSKLRYVLDVIERHIDQLQQTSEEQQNEIVEMKRNFWDQVTLDQDDMFESYVSVMQQTQDLANHERVQAHAGKLLQKLNQHKGSPYFGRIQFREDGDDETLDIYIGLMSLTDDQADAHLVYDWRTPIASLFYDYAAGPVQYRTPVGLITGEMPMKRQFVIRRGRLEAVFDTGIQIGDDMLQEMLAKSSDTKMRSIVSTIQREQNAIIRDDSHDVLIVQGAAGSGKTSAAMQRIAYLLYKYRNSIRSEQVVLFSPNDLFNDYVSNILPELGEANMSQTTFQNYLEHRLHTRWQLEDLYDQAERLMRKPTGEEAIGTAAQSVQTSTKQTDETAAVNETAGVRDSTLLELASARWKASFDFMQVMDRYIDHLTQEGMQFVALGTPKRTIVTQEMMAEQFYVVLADWSLTGRLHKLQEWVKQYVNSWAKAEEKRVYNKLLQKNQYIGTEQELRDISRKQVRKWVQRMRRQTRVFGFVDWEGMYVSCMQQLGHWVAEVEHTRVVGNNSLPDAKLATQIGHYTAKRLSEHGILPFEDTSPFLYLIERTQGFHTFNHIRHVVIDEAQDYSPFQYELLNRLFPRSRFTILGDWNQAIYEANRVNSVEMVQQMFKERKTDIVRLAKSYRSTRNITEYAQRIIPDGEPAQAFNRSGSAPRLYLVETEEERLAAAVRLLRELERAGAGSAALITKDESTSAYLYELLREQFPDMRQVTKFTRQFAAGYWVMPSYLAKGLEFDGVIIYDADQASYGKESDRKLLYTVCTRALHELSLIALKEPSKLLPSS
ncbi:UvrD-helicase domain-containing protein [Paenibacillus sp. ACRRX]|uniref:RNA polymerase recycling motor HelD n=1 Tax=Paenibacillus sp. ACRRX TaxID=2918206 RepID=UPI001EF5B49B|nr:UvrD-helicase domain-containing protein [Paenibacillus sp. ACRRX]